MTLSQLINVSTTFTSPPAGARNVALGPKVKGPGGDWVPCATRAVDGSFYPGLFQIGPGMRQVCVTALALSSADEALSRAAALASEAAA